MEIEHRVFEYSGASGETYEGYLALPKNINGTVPGVLVIHAFHGVTELEIERAKQLAKLGFAALAADIYGKGKRGKTFEECRAFMQPYASDRPGLLKQSLITSYNALKSVSGVDGNRMAAMGFCFGGMCALDLARHHIGLKVAVSFHGTLTPLPGAPIDKTDVAIQVHHGDADIHIPKDVVEALQQELRDRDSDWSFINYGKAAHGFTNPEADSFNKPGLGYNREADVRSWAATIALLKEKLL